MLLHLAQGDRHSIVSVGKLVEILIVIEMLSIVGMCLFHLNARVALRLTVCQLVFFLRALKHIRLMVCDGDSLTLKFIAQNFNKTECSVENMTNELVTCVSEKCCSHIYFVAENPICRSAELRRTQHGRCDNNYHY